MTITAYPLAWPTGWPRVAPQHRKFGRFTKAERQYSAVGANSWVRRKDLTVTDGIGRVLQELERMGIERQDVVISTNLRTRLDGLPRSGEARPDDPGVAVYWQEHADDGARRVMAIDIYTDVADNLAAVAASLEAMRAIERHGGAQILERAFTGFAALPEPGKSKHWRDIFGFGTLPATRRDVDLVYRRMASAAHPDRGGSNEAMAELNRARDQAYEECNG